MSAPPPPALALRGLFKRFQHVVAVAGVDLDVPRSSFFGLVGPNGAGKSTTIAMSTGLLRPDAGTVFANGIDVWADPITAKAQIGVLPEGLRLFERLTGRELLIHTGLLRRMPRDVVEQRAKELLAALGLTGAAEKMVVDYSTGMKKKIALSVAMLHAPRLLVLDEPFEAVDPVSALTIRNILQRYVESGGTVLMSSHVMELVQRLCDHVAVIDRGTIVAAGPIGTVTGGRALDEVFVDIVGAAPSTADLDWLTT